MTASRLRLAAYVTAGVVAYALYAAAVLGLL
jgi:hypothetical protein